MAGGESRALQAVRVVTAMSMILPVADSSGYVEQGYGTPMWLHNDTRVPRPVGRDHEARLLVSYLGDCDRHLFDVVESARDVETELPDGEWAHHEEFTARLTCVKCGVIVAWEGTRKPEVRGSAPVNPVPLVAGDLTAQMIDAGRGGAFGNRDWSTWAVHRGNERVGVIAWGCGRRGREFFAARLFTWPGGEHVEAPTPAAALRKLGKAARTTAAAS